MKRLILIAITIVLLDQLSKIWIVNQFYYGETRPVIEGFFSLTLVYNTGGAFGLLANKTILFILFSLLTIIALMVYYFKYRSRNGWIVWPFGLVLGGAVGNLIDRTRLGHVIDFLDVYVANWHWPAFNVADSAICVGLGLLVLFMGKIQ